jgi:hypothetical protein
LDQLSEAAGVRAGADEQLGAAVAVEVSAEGGADLSFGPAEELDQVIAAELAEHGVARGGGAGGEEQAGARVAGGQGAEGAHAEVDGGEGG